MKQYFWNHIKQLLFILFIFLFVSEIKSAELGGNLIISDSLVINRTPDTLVYNNTFYIKTDQIYDQKIHKNKYEKHLDKYESFWVKLIPSYQKIQMYGSIGLVSLGKGWEYCNNKMETEIMLGFIPKYDDRRAKLTFTIRENYIPFTINIKDNRISFNPLTTGLYINSILDNRFWKKEPERYPENYYKFSTRIRFHLALGQRFNFDLDGDKSIHKSISVFYEVGTCDLYMISAVTNKYLSPKDYLGLSFGLKLQIF